MTLTQADIKDICMIFSILLGAYSTWRIMRKDSVEESNRHENVIANDKMTNLKLDHIADKVDSISKHLDDRLPAELKVINDRINTLEKEWLVFRKRKSDERIPE